MFSSELPTPEKLIERFKLRRHPEGGYYVRTYRSDVTISQAALGEHFSGDRPCATAILYLLDGNDVSRLHRLKQDEIWHFYLGDALELATISPDGALSIIRMGADLCAGDRVQWVVPAGCWFGARVTRVDGYALVGCTVSPGFDFGDHELADLDALAVQFPDLIGQIARFALPISESIG